MQLSGRKKRAVSIALGMGLTGAMVSGMQVPFASAAPSEVTVPLPSMTSLDPTQWGGQILIDQGTVFEGLAGYNQKNQIVPKIATKWTVSKNGKVWTFYLRHDAKWSNGQPVTANDFYYAWMRLASPQDSTGALWAGAVQYAANAWSYHAGQVPASKVGLKVLNKWTLQLTEASPHDLTGELPLSGSMPLYKPSVEAHPTNWFMPQYFVGDGPYLLKSFISNGNISLVKNTKYVGPKNQFNVGNVQQINIIPAPTVPVEDYMANKMDIASITTPADYQYVQTHADLKSQLHIAPQNQITYLQWDKSIDASPLDKQMVRQAIIMAINKAPIVNPVLNGMGGVANGFGPPGWPSLNQQHALPYDVQKARQLLAKAGYPNGKGMPTLYIYTQTAPSPLVSVAMAIAQELKQNLNLNIKINPTAATLWGNITWGGLNKGILPGFNIATGVANWKDPGNMDLQGDAAVTPAGAIGPASYRKYISNWYFPTYDPVSVKKYGNPDNTKLGVSWSDWVPLQKAALADIKYLNAWMKKQPKLYQIANQATPGSTNTDIWNGLVADWKKAKTASEKHSDWVTAWKFVGNYSAGNGGANAGLDGQVYQDQHEPKLQHDVKMWMSELGVSTSQAQENDLTAKITNGLMQSGYATPLYYGVTIYLEKPNVTGIQPNPWSWNNFYQLQYLSVK